MRAASTRSADLFSSLVEIAPSDPCLAETWRAILAVLREQGDFGAMDFESDDLVAWAKRDRTEHVLADIVRRLEEPTSYALRRAVGADIHDETAAQVRLKGQSQPVYVSKHRVVMKFDVRGVERFWIQFYAHSRGEAFFIAEARHQDPKAELDPALRALPGLQHGRDSTGHSWKLPSIRAKDLPSGAAVHDALLEHIAETIGALQASGLFDRLPDGPATAQPEFESPDAADGEAPAQM